VLVRGETPAHHQLKQIEKQKPGSRRDLWLLKVAEAEPVCVSDVSITHERGDRTLTRTLFLASPSFSISAAHCLITISLRVCSMNSSQDLLVDLEKELARVMVFGLLPLASAPPALPVGGFGYCAPMACGCGFATLVPSRVKTL